jgi:hypothetical protein
MVTDCLVAKGIVAGCNVKAAEDSLNKSWNKFLQMEAPEQLFWEDGQW